MYSVMLNLNFSTKVAQLIQLKALLQNFTVCFWEASVLKWRF